MKPIQIAIDGPAGAGKSTVAKRLAKKLDFCYIDTGAMYRALTLKAIKKKHDLNSSGCIKQLLSNTEIEIKNIRNEIHIFLDNKDVTYEIRQPEISNNVSNIAKIPEVRDHMLHLQREMAQCGKVVMEGRDIGTVVLPEADIKFFLTASLEARANRRFLELEKKGYSVDIDSIAQEIAIRDKIDSKRQSAPLLKADDAIEVDTSNYDIDEAVDVLVQEIKKRLD
ncbi:(d)CMP kinase [Proteinivorax hydrogeniformans]|uniref:Cytidylate kinase n=1 Tax=Proteinivorax hydrogeniformans TaxID=1826727 RepID=A0AAU8HWM3_9FIRM